MKNYLKSEKSGLGSRFFLLLINGLPRASKPHLSHFARVEQGSRTPLLTSWSPTKAFSAAEHSYRSPSPTTRTREVAEELARDRRIERLEHVRPNLKLGMLSYQNPKNKKPPAK